MPVKAGTNQYIEFVKKHPAHKNETPQERIKRVAQLYRTSQGSYDGGYYGLADKVIPAHTKPGARRTKTLENALNKRGYNLESDAIKSFIIEEQLHDTRKKLKEITKELNKNPLTKRAPKPRKQKAQLFPEIGEKRITESQLQQFIKQSEPVKKLTAKLREQVKKLSDL